MLPQLYLLQPQPSKLFLSFVRAKALLAALPSRVPCAAGVRIGPARLRGFMVRNCRLGSAGADCGVLFCNIMPIEPPSAGRPGSKLVAPTPRFPAFPAARAESFPAPAPATKSSSPVRETPSRRPLQLRQANEPSNPLTAGIQECWFRPAKGSTLRPPPCKKFTGETAARQVQRSPRKGQGGEAREGNFDSLTARARAHLHPSQRCRSLGQMGKSSWLPGCGNGGAGSVSAFNRGIRPPAKPGKFRFRWRETHAEHRSDFPLFPRFNHVKR
ncbi:hypothetical protein F5144DRAFT_356903 [Chaetomium tenue]|uniref:Uncharacterized protein n=1 Tax=Chaetomium tenue TaxID=1854479 RepID=A0ACB7NY66_9PEZI|nr:hypothetical protein F5144DRAFT_356903 [Chaetomium globosum]